MQLGWGARADTVTCRRNAQTRGPRREHKLHSGSRDLASIKRPANFCSGAPLRLFMMRRAPGRRLR
jgi:hypothetical protein